MDIKHTPTPWHLANGDQVHDRQVFFDESGARTGDTPNVIAITEAMPFETASANAAFIVRACNAHADLLANLKAAIAAHDAWAASSDYDGSPEPDYVTAGRVAVAKAEGRI